MTRHEKQRVVMNCRQVAGPWPTSPVKNALQKRCCFNRAGLRTRLMGAEQPVAVGLFLNEPDQFRKAEEVAYNDERRRGRPLERL